MQRVENKEEIEFRKKTLHLLQMLEEVVLDSSLKEFKKLTESNDLKSFEEFYKSGLTNQTPTVIDALQSLMETNYDRDELLKECHIVGQQYDVVMKEYEYYKGLMNELEKNGN